MPSRGKFHGCVSNRYTPPLAWLSQCFFLFHVRRVAFASSSRQCYEGTIPAAVLSRANFRRRPLRGIPSKQMPALPAFPGGKASADGNSRCSEATRNDLVRLVRPFLDRCARVVYTSRLIRARDSSCVPTKDSSCCISRGFSLAASVETTRLAGFLFHRGRVSTLRSGIERV
jgi:hypothetical protein